MSNLEEALLEVVQECESMATTIEASVSDSDYDWNMKARIRSVRTALNDAKSLAEALLEDVARRVYCIEVTSTVEQTIKVLAKTEDDAIREAVEVAERRIRFTLGIEHDYDVWSEAHSHGDESPQDDDADIEVHYDD
jgi:hypothetical protein